MDNTMKYTHSEYGYTTITAEWEPRYAMMGELPEDTLRTTSGFDTAAEEAARDTEREIHEWIAERLKAAEPFNYSITEGDYTRSVTHNWSGEHLQVTADLGGLYDAPSVEILYDGISEEAGQQMEDTTMMDEAMEEFERIICEERTTGTNYNDEPVVWVTTIEERMSEICCENFYEALYDNSVRFDVNIWNDHRQERPGVVTEERMVEFQEDYDSVIKQLADDDSLWIPAAHSVSEDGEILLSTMGWWEGNTTDIDTADGWGELPGTPANRLKVIEYLQASQGVICVPKGDCSRSVAKRDVTYRWEASADADDIKAANGYLFDLSMVADAEFYSEAA